MTGTFGLYLCLSESFNLSCNRVLLLRYMFFLKVFDAR